MFRNVTLRLYFSRKSEALGVIFKKDYITHLLTTLKFDYVSFSYITGIFDGNFEPSVKVEKLLSEHWSSNIPEDIIDIVYKSGYLSEYLGQMSIICEIRFSGKIIYFEITNDNIIKLHNMYKEILTEEKDPRYWQSAVGQYYGDYNISFSWVEKYL